MADPVRDDLLPVLAEVRTLEAEPARGEVVRPAASPAVQAAAVAATGFVAGAATVALARRRAARKAMPSRRKRKSVGRELGEVVSSRSFLVDIHLLGPRD